MISLAPEKAGLAVQTEILRSEKKCPGRLDFIQPITIIVGGDIAMVHLMLDRPSIDKTFALAGWQTS